MSHGLKLQHGEQAVRPGRDVGFYKGHERVSRNESMRNGILDKYGIGSIGLGGIYTVHACIGEYIHGCESICIGIARNFLSMFLLA